MSLRLITPFCSIPGILEAIKDKEIRIIISGNCGFELDRLIVITGLVRKLRPPQAVPLFFKLKFKVRCPSPKAQKIKRSNVVPATTGFQAPVRALGSK